MNNRFMRIVLFFDLPVVESEDRREYSHFHKYLVKNGFMMMQESVYCKLVLNPTAAEAVMENLRKNKPPKGLIQTMLVTEKQFSRMEYILGESTAEVLNTDERLVVF